MFVLALAVGLAVLAPPPVNAGASGLGISEFMAANSSTLADEEGDYSDWIEIHNASPNDIDLLNWSLTDNAGALTKWRFPSTNLPAGGYLIVFASEKNRRTPGAPLHTNFKLSSNGEYLALVQPDGVKVESAYAPLFPLQATDISYGFGKITVDTLLLRTGAIARVLVPRDDSLGTAWIEPAFDDAAWRTGPTGLGYEVGTTRFRPFIATDLQTAMHRTNGSVFVRIPFVVPEPADFDHLRLEMQYDDGFVAYLNGLQIVAANEPFERAWNSLAATDRPDTNALSFETFNLDGQRALLRPGTNWLALHGLNSASFNPNFLLVPRLVAGRDTTATNVLRYFATPSPGAANGAGAADLGPLVIDPTYRPLQPTDADSIHVTARVAPSFASVREVALRYRVMFSNEVAIPMLDDGAHQDGSAGDGVFGATIPAQASTPGQLVRWKIVATDTAGRGSRFPAFDNPLASSEYLGVMVASTVTSALPVLHWFVQNPPAAETDSGTRCSLFFDGEFYDNVEVHIRGQAARGYPKKSFKFDFNPGHRFRFDRNLKRVEEINVNTTYADKSFLRVTLAWESFRNAGAPWCLAFPLRMQQNNAFYSVATFLEEPDEDMLTRNGLDPNGALYKMFTSLEAASGNQKTTRLHEDFRDLQTLVTALGPANTNRAAYLFDNINIPAVLDYLAVICVLHDNDCPHKNYWMYRDTDGTGEWRLFPWDKDLCLGRNYDGLSDDIWANLDVIAGRPNVSPSHPFFMDQTHQKIDYKWNRLVDALYAVPAIKDMYRRHLRTVMERQLQAPGTPSPEFHFEQRIQELYQRMRPDVSLDRAKWSYGYGAQLTFEQGIAQIVTNYLPLRRIHLFQTHHETNRAYALNARLPGPQRFDAVILFGAVEFNPASGNQDEEFIELINTHRFAVDLSGWRLSGAVEHTFQPGVVMPAGSVMYVSPNVRAFRARATGPRGGQSLFVQGNYRGRLSARGEALQLADDVGRLVAETQFVGSPSLAQQFLRVTEVMFHPSPPPPGSPYVADDFEYVELRNVGSGALDLTGVRFVEGIQFAFAGGGVKTLNAGERVLVVKHLEAFASRYGASRPVAGQYVGHLDNAGERLRLLDAAHENILNFDYNEDWYPITDGAGFSLVIVDDTAPWNGWDRKPNWRPSTAAQGSPGKEDPAPPAFPPVVVNEVLSSSPAPLVDAVELFNASPFVADLSHWWLTDDFATPKKYRFPPGTTIPPGGYLVMTETNFNPTPGVPPSFAFSGDGDEVFLFSGDASGELTGYVHGFALGAADVGVTFGRHLHSTGEEQFVAQSARTLGGSNAPPRVGPVVLSEIMYHPTDDPDGHDDPQLEFVELHNVSDDAVSMHDPVQPWRLDGEVEFDFPPSASLPPGGYAIVVSFDPFMDPTTLDKFRGFYGLTELVPIFGPYRGQLDNQGGRLSLQKPGPLTVGSATRPYVVVDELDYNDRAPWETAADGSGASLQRKRASEHGHDPARWAAAAPPTPGRAYAGGAAPSLSGQPFSQVAVAGRDASLTVAATGAGPLRYQWRKDGINLFGATNATLALRNVRRSQAGVYQAEVFNPAGSVTTSNTTLVVQMPPTIYRQPEDLVAAVGTNTWLEVEAAGSGTLSYQWRFNGADIAGATQATLPIADARLTNSGLYSVLITSEYGAVLSQEARLTVRMILVQPQSQTVSSGTNIVLAVTAVGAGPLIYQWRKDGTNLPGATNPTLPISNVRPEDDGVYSVVVSDAVTSVESEPARLTVLVLPAFVEHPQSTTLLPGQTLRLRVAVTGNLPLGYRWRRNSSSIEIQVLNARTSTLMIPNAQLNHAGSYDVVVTNAANRQGILSGKAVVTVLADFDRDGMADLWEQSYGFNTNSAADATLDTDQDGLTNLQEYEAGTHPTNTASLLRLDATRHAGEGQPQWELSFAAASNKSYTLQWISSLSSANWSNLLSFPAPPTQHNFILTNVPAPASGTNFYRLVTPRQP